MIGGPATNACIKQPENKDQIRLQLLAVKADVNRLYTIFDSSKASGKTRSPGLHYFNTLEWLQFAEMHMRYHLRQKRRIDEKLLYMKEDSR